MRQNDKTRNEDGLQVEEEDRPGYEEIKVEKETRVPRGTLTRARVRRRRGCFVLGREYLWVPDAHMHQAAAGSSRMPRRRGWKGRRDAIPPIRKHSGARFVPHALCIHGRCIIRTVRAAGVRARHTRRRRASSFQPRPRLPRSMDLIDRRRTTTPPHVPPLNRCWAHKHAAHKLCTCRSALAANTHELHILSRIIRKHCNLPWILCYW